MGAASTRLVTPDTAGPPYAPALSRRRVSAEVAPVVYPEHPRTGTGENRRHAKEGTRVTVVSRRVATQRPTPRFRHSWISPEVPRQLDTKRAAELQKVPTVTCTPSTA